MTTINICGNVNKEVIVMDAEEVLFITFREDLKRFVDKWETVFKTVGYLSVPTTIANAMVSIEEELKYVDYNIPCEKDKQ